LLQKLPGTEVNHRYQRLSKRKALEGGGLSQVNQVGVPHHSGCSRALSF
jgi:hypothetical protein